MECSTKVFVEGALGVKAHMSQAVGCLVITFQADNIKNAKKLTGHLGALNTATHGAIAKAIEQGDLEPQAGSTLMLNATDAWAKLGLKAERLLLVCTDADLKTLASAKSGQQFSKWLTAGLKALIASSAKDALWVFTQLPTKDGLSQARLLVQLAREQLYKFGARHPNSKLSQLKKHQSSKSFLLLVMPKITKIYRRRSQKVLLLPMVWI